MTNVWSRVQDAPLGAKITAALATAAQAALGDVFTWFLVLLLAANVGDYLAGRRAARLRRQFSRTASRQGVLGKGIAVMIVLLVRAAELILSRFGPELDLPSTRGLIAAAITAFLVYEEVESLEKHRASLGLRPIPLLSWGLDKLRGLTGGERRDDSTRKAA